MEQNTPNFRLRLNLFDAIILVLVLIVGGVMAWLALRPSVQETADPAVTTTVRYTVRFQRWAEGASSLIEVGDKLTDNIKNYALGTVVSCEAVPCVTQVLDQEARRYVEAPIEGYEDVLVTVESPCAASDAGFVLDGGYELRVGITTYIKGEGYMASGPVVAVEREGQA